MNIVILEKLHTSTKMQLCFHSMVGRPLMKSMEMDLQGLEGLAKVGITQASCYPPMPRGNQKKSCLMAYNEDSDPNDNDDDDEHVHL
jgi:hypothetical protein